MSSAAARLLIRLLNDDVQISAADGELHFDGPDCAVTENLLADMRAHKDELLTWLTDTDPARLVRRRSLPAFNQQELWHKDRRSGAPVVYTVAQRWNITGPLDVTAVKDAVNWWLARHETLRSRFSVISDGEDAQPVLEIVAPWREHLSAIDLTGPDGEARLDREVAECVNRPIPLKDAPLWRLMLFRMSESTHVLVWMFHHIICDGTSMTVLRDELVAAYESLRVGDRPQAPSIAAGPTDHARSQRRKLSGERLSRLVDHWRDRLSGARLDLAFDADRPRPDRLSGRGDILLFTLPPSILAGLRRTAKRRDTTLYIVMLSAYATMLSEFTGQSEVVLPVSQSGRLDAEYPNVVGMLADRFPIRITVAEAADFPALVEQVGHRVFDAMDHQGLPLSLLLPRLRPEQRPVGAYPAALFTLLDGFQASPQAKDLTIDIGSEAPVGTARMEFYCFMTTGEEGLEGWLEYSTDRFEAATVRRWIDRFLEIVNEIE